MNAIPDLKHISEPIADDDWSYIGADGKRVTSRVVVGKPQRWPNDSQGDWICPVSIDDFTDGVSAVAGVGPVDALLNAMSIIRAFVDQIGRFTPRAANRVEARPAHSGSVLTKTKPAAKKKRSRSIARRRRQN